MVTIWLRRPLESSNALASTPEPQGDKIRVDSVNWRVNSSQSHSTSALTIVVRPVSSALLSIDRAGETKHEPIAVFDQPPCPGDGYIWIPGYYQYGDYGYYWVPGHWVMPPSVGVLWTPGYWGFAGGRWEGNMFRHNTVVTNIDRNNVHNVYEDRTVVREVKGPNHSYNGKGGSQARPSHEEESAARAPHQGPTPAQVSHAQEAHNNHLAAHGHERK